jgi:SAM-dependent methyltransferase
LSTKGYLNYQRLYDFRFRDVDQEARQRVWDVIAADLYVRMGRPARVLDPAAGRCEFINAIPAAERWVVDHVDHAPFRQPGVQAVIADIFDADLPDGHFDGVFVSNFLEHLDSQEDVARLLVKLHATMAPGGVILLLGPNYKYATRSYFDFADHTLALSHVAACEHVYAAGFTTESVVPRFLPLSFRGVLPPSPALTRTYLRFPLLWPVLGKQFLILARKPPAADAAA